jgi:hypothetical protein
MFSPSSSAQTLETHINEKTSTTNSADHGLFFSVTIPATPSQSGKSSQYEFYYVTTEFHKNPAAGELMKTK